MAEAIYRLEGVSKSYSGREVCRIDCLEIAPGEVFAIMGPSGAGKSTLLRLLNFLEPPTSGILYFRGVRVNGSRPPPLELRRQVTMVFQEPLLLDSGVESNVVYGLRLRGQPDAGQRVREALDRVGLLTLAKAPARTLSIGEKQRVALARALVLSPRVLLLDEPTANLDPYNVSLLEELITSVNRERGTTVVVVTHNVFQARRLSRRAGLMLEGRLVEVGETERLFTSPGDPRTAAFIRGEMVY